MENEKDLQAVAEKLHGIVKESGVTLHEAEIAYNLALGITRETPGLQELFEQWRNAPIK